MINGYSVTLQRTSALLTKKASNGRHSSNLMLIPFLCPPFLVAKKMKLQVRHFRSADRSGFFCTYVAPPLSFNLSVNQYVETNLGPIPFSKKVSSVVPTLKESDDDDDAHSVNIIAPNGRTCYLDLCSRL